MSFEKGFSLARGKGERVVLFNAGEPETVLLEKETQGLRPKFGEVDVALQKLSKMFGEGVVPIELPE